MGRRNRWKAVWSSAEDRRRTGSEEKKTAEVMWANNAQWRVSVMITTVLSDVC